MSNPFTVQTVRCAGPNCVAVRNQVNHWFVVRRVNLEGVADAFACFPYDARMQLKAADQPACGQACAQKLLEQYMEQRRTA